MTDFLSPDAHPTSSQFPDLPEGVCISIIGMAGAGKTTLGRKLASLLGWAFADTDFLIEAAYGAPLQDVTDATTKEEFLDLEAAIVSSLRFNRCVVSTGGSVVYRQTGMDHLAALGPIVHLDVAFSVIEERITRAPDRGLAINPGQTIQDLYLEREKLYHHYADISYECGQRAPGVCARDIIRLVAGLSR